MDTKKEIRHSEKASRSLKMGSAGAVEGSEKSKKQGCKSRGSFGHEDTAL